MIPTGRTLALLVLGLPLAALPTALPATWPVVLGLWLAVGLGIGVDLLRLRRGDSSAEVEAPVTVPVGGVVRTPVHLRGFDGGLRTELRVELGEPYSADSVFTAWDDDGEPSAELTFPVGRRGTVSLDAIHARVYGPLGLVARVTRHALERVRIDVVPDVARVADAVKTHLGAEPMLSGLKRDPWGGNGSEFEALTTYAQGMDPRDVDWKASARHHALRVRRFHLERRQRVVVSLDRGRAMGDPIEGLDRLDHAVHTGLALARAALLAGDQVGLHAYGERPFAFLPPRAGHGQLQRMRRATASLTVEDAETNHVLGLRDLLVRLDRRSFVAVFTEFGDATTAELMVEVLGHLARKHVVVFVALDDPVVTRPLGRPPESAGAIASAVVAASLGERRTDVLARLDALGVRVIHTSAGAVVGQVLDRYLDVKRRGVLG